MITDKPYSPLNKGDKVRYLPFLPDEASMLGYSGKVVTVVNYYGADPAHDGSVYLDRPHFTIEEDKGEWCYFGYENGAWEIVERSTNV